MIEALKGKGVPRAKAICDDCGKEEVVSCDYERAAKGRSTPNEGQIRTRVASLGWSFVKGKLRCPSCEAKRKTTMPAPSSETEPARQPTRAQKHEIMDLLRDVYDMEAECYRRGDTDDTVADVLDVMPGWVAQIREEFFGGAGGNEEMEALKADLVAFLQSSEEAISTFQELTLPKMLAEVGKAEKLLHRLENIEKAVGARVMSRVAK